MKTILPIYTQNNSPANKVIELFTPNSAIELNSANNIFFTIPNGDLVGKNRGYILINTSNQAYFFDLPLNPSHQNIVTALSKLPLSMEFYYDVALNKICTIVPDNLYNNNFWISALGLFNTADTPLALTGTPTIHDPNFINFSPNGPILSTIQSLNFKIKVNGVNQVLDDISFNAGTGPNDFQIYVSNPIAHGDVVTYSYIPAVVVNGNYNSDVFPTWPAGVFAQNDLTQLPAVTNAAVTNPL